METLKYKTRGNSHPRGKSKVYFCSHPDDFQLYFDSLSDDILEIENCAIYYHENLNEEDLLDDLSQMQMVVIPITAKFLFQTNKAREVVFTYVLNHHIPILPVMEDVGLASYFNQICGNLQFLNPNQQERTEIPYKQKLKEMILSVLLGDELKEKIRSAFDAYVFLSYRKKDRQYAQELMELIHKNEFCRDIAIWYDEFLTPGENFNGAIEKALKKSQLFALVVTPNLVNEDNYVMKIEYPMAMNEAKKIFPAELVPTSHIELKQKYQNIPDCVDTKDESVFSQRLLHAI